MHSKPSMRSLEDTPKLTQKLQASAQIERPRALMMFHLAVFEFTLPHRDLRIQPAARDVYSTKDSKEFTNWGYELYLSTLDKIVDSNWIDLFHGTGPSVLYSSWCNAPIHAHPTVLSSKLEAFWILVSPAM